MAGHVVHRKNGVAGVFGEQAVFHHLHRAAQTFFGGLKNQVHGARELAFLRNVFGCSQQHGGVPVVAASVHDAGVATGIGQAGGFVNRQGVHIGANADRLAAVAAFQLAHQTGAAQTALDLVAPSGQLLGHQITGAVFLVAHLGVLVDVTPHGDEFIGIGLQGLEFVVQKSVARSVHRKSLSKQEGRASSSRLNDLLISGCKAFP